MRMKLAAAVLIAASSAFAQSAGPVNIFATVASFQGATLSVTEAGGEAAGGEGETHDGRS